MRLLHSLRSFAMTEKNIVRNDRGECQVIKTFILTDTLLLFHPPHPNPLPPWGEVRFVVHPVCRSASKNIRNKIQRNIYKRVRY